MAGQLTEAVLQRQLDLLSEELVTKVSQEVQELLRNGFAIDPGPTPQASPSGARGKSGISQDSEDLACVRPTKYKLTEYGIRPLVVLDDYRPLAQEETDGSGDLEGQTGTLTRERSKKRLPSKRSTANLGDVFEGTIGFLVLANAIALGIETNMDCIYFMHPPEQIRVLISWVNLMFTLAFLIEWILRVQVHGWHFFTIDAWYWNWFDTFIIGMQILDQALKFACEYSLRAGVVSTVRLLRLCRVLRIVRLLRLFKELSRLVHYIVMSASALAWSMVLMLTSIYAFSVTFALRTVTVTCQGEAIHANDCDIHDYSKKLHYYFGDVPRTALTLMECILSGLSWNDPARTLFSDVGWFSGMVFLIYVSVGVFILVNLVAGVFLDQIMRSAKDGSDENAALDLAAAFGLDKEDSQLSWEQFKVYILKPEMREFFHSIDIDMDASREIFEILDTDGNQTLTSREVVDGCTRLRGTARVIDIAVMMQNQKAMNEFMIQQIDLLKSLLKDKRRSRYSNGSARSNLSEEM